MAVDERTTRRHVAALTAALAANDHAGAASELAALRERLPPRSLTLLRFEAWTALVAGDDRAARQHYQALLERVPEDLNAGINLALLDARAGRLDAAAERIDQLGYRHGREPELQRAQATVQRLQAEQAALQQLERRS